MATSQPGNKNFLVAGAKVISLAVDVVTDSLIVGDSVTDWVIQPSTVTGLAGSPVYTLQGCLSGDDLDFDDILPEFGKNIPITETMFGDTIRKGMFIRVKIDVGDGSAGTCELLSSGLND